MQESIDNSVLIVEDDARLQSVLARGLRRLGFEVHTAGSLAGARDALSTIQISAIVVDLGLPDGSGWDLVRWTRSVAGIHPRTIVVTTAIRPALRPGRRAGRDTRQTVRHRRSPSSPAFQWLINIRRDPRGDIFGDWLCRPNMFLGIMALLLYLVLISRYGILSRSAIGRPGGTEPPGDGAGQRVETIVRRPACRTEYRASVRIH
ncbi:MAG: response regulator [Thermomicrobiales bacterium]